MKEFTTVYINEKNQLESRKPWAILVELEVNANTTAYFTSHPETHTWNGRTYAPVPLNIAAEEVAADGSFPSMTVDIANYQAQAFKFAKDNDLSLNDVWLRIVNTTLTGSGSDARIKMQISDAIFTNEIGRFTLDVPINKDVYGPKRQYDRQSFPSIPWGFKNYMLVG